MDAVEADMPAVVLDRKQERAAPAVGRGPVDHRAPVARRRRRYIEGSRCIAEIDTDLGLIGSWHAEAIQRLEGERAARGCVDDQIRRERCAFAIGKVVADPDDRRYVGRCQKSSDATTRLQPDIGLLFDAASHHKFHQRPCHAERVEIEIAQRKRIEPRRFDPNFGTDPGPHRARLLKLRLEIGKEFGEGVETALEKNMNLPRLRRSGARFRSGR